MSRANCSRFSVSATPGWCPVSHPRTSIATSEYRRCCDDHSNPPLRILVTSTSLGQAADAMQVLTAVVAVADMAETDRLLATLEAWWPAIEVLIITGVTNARTEAANTTIKNIKRTGRGFRNAQNYRTRILLNQRRDDVTCLL